MHCIEFLFHVFSKQQNMYLAGHVCRDVYTMTRKLLVLFFFFFSGIIVPAAVLSAQQSLPAAIAADTTLTRSASPYLLNSQLTILSGATLTVEPGVTLLIADGVGIRNEGRFMIGGTEQLPVLFIAADGEQRWNYIYNTGTMVARHLFVRRATRFLNSYGDTVIIDRCSVDDTYSIAGADLIGVHDAKKVLILNSVFNGNPEAGKTDAIDLDGISGDTVARNTITGFSDDGIDIGTGSTQVVISENRISQCEMAISIGEQSTVLVSHNLLIHSHGGIQTHTGAVVRALQNTIYGNAQAIRALHYSHETTSGGTIHLTNTIIAATSGTEVIQTDNSAVTIEYCLADSLLLPGEGNITGDPGFADPAAGDFRLTPGSAAIDAGDPDRDRDGIPYTSDPDDRDPDGTRPDLGCFPFYQSAVTLVELSPSNLSILADDSGSYSDWIILHNATGTTVNLNGHYLSDDPADPLKHRFTTDIIIPPGDSLRLWADDQEAYGPLHLGFRLSGEGEHILLSDTAGTLMEQVAFPRIPVNHFYRKTGDPPAWHYCTITSGTDTAAYPLPQGTPRFSSSGGATPFPVTTGLSADKNGMAVYYTVDATNPDSGMLYQAPLQIGSPLTLRAVAKSTGSVPGYAHARSFFAEGAYPLPVVALSANWADLYGERGIYKNYSSGGPLWERPVSFSWYNGGHQLHALTGMRIQGGNSVWMKKKSFRLHFRGGYGTSRLHGSPFADGPAGFKNLVLRAGYDDDITTTSGTLLRDPFSAELWKRMGELATESTFGVLLLNGDYRGIYNVRESINNYFVEDKLGIRAFDLVRFQKWGPDLKYGTMEAWDRMMVYFDTTDFTRPEAYDEVASFMDMHSLLNLLSLVHCSQFRSWTWGAFAIRPEGGKWRWTIWDTDRSYNTLYWNGFTEYNYTNAEKWPNIIPQQLMKNERFRHALINRNCDLLNTLFVPDHAIAVYDSLVGLLTPAMDAEFERWNPWNRERWDLNNEKVRDFLQQRPAYLYDQMTSLPGTGDTTTLQIRITGNGHVRLNSLDIDQSGWTGTYMEGVPVVLEAIPGRGSVFTGWEDGPESHRITIDPAEATSFVAVFDTTSAATQQPLVINEIMYHPSATGLSEWVELYNPNSVGIPLGGYVLTDGGVDNRYLFPENEVIDPEGYVVVAGSLPGFATEYGMQVHVVGSFNEGTNGFKLSNGGETLVLEDPEGATADRVPYYDSYPWPYMADGYGPSLQLRSPDMDNSDPASWYAGMEQLSTPGRENSTGTGAVAAAPAPFEYRVYPNPAGQTLYVELPDGSDGTTTVELITLSGRKIAEKILRGGTGGSPHAWHHGITVPGAYILRLTSSEDTGPAVLVSSALIIISLDE